MKNLISFMRTFVLLKLTTDIFHILEMCKKCTPTRFCKCTRFGTSVGRHIISTLLLTPELDHIARCVMGLFCIIWATELRL